MNFPSESKIVSTGSPGELAKKYLELANSYKRLEFESVCLKTKAELIIRHIDSLNVRDQHVKKFILKRLQDAVGKFEREFSGLKANVRQEEIIETKKLES